MGELVVEVIVAGQKRTVGQGHIRSMHIRDRAPCFVAAINSGKQ
jgi:hypothetical protein